MENLAEVNYYHLELNIRNYFTIRMSHENMYKLHI